MSTVATANVPVRPLRPSGGASAAGVALVAAAASVLVRWRAIVPFPQFSGACQRHRSGGYVICRMVQALIAGTLRRTRID